MSGVTPDLRQPPAAPSGGHGLLTDKVIVITAAAGTGIGSALAQRCLAEGARVVVSDWHERRLMETRDRLESLAPGRVHAVTCDVTSEDDVQHLFEATVEQAGGFHVLMNNAGLGGSHRITDMTDGEWSRILDVSLTGTFRTTRAAFQTFARLGSGGAIVNNASVSGWRAQEGQAAYGAAKAGVMALTRVAAVEGVALGVRVNAVAPSFAAHPFLAKAAPQDVLDELASRELYGRPAEPWEVAHVMIFLASDYASYMSGEVVSVSSQRA